MKKTKVFIKSLAFALVLSSQASELKVGDLAPDFTLKTQDSSEFKLSSRKGLWTVLYFYPKADTPGCTKQACAFRDRIKVIRDQGADVFGISVNSVKDQLDFHKKHALNFQLLADEKAEVTKLYGAKMPVLNISKRWTFIIDPDLKIRALEKDVDPAFDSQRVADAIVKFKQTPAQ